MAQKNNAAGPNRPAADAILIPQDEAYCEALEGLAPRNRPWTPREEAIVRRYYARGVPAQRIAAQIGRAFNAVQARAARLGVRFASELR